MYIDLSIPITRQSPGVKFDQWLHGNGIRQLSKRIRNLPGDSPRERVTNYLRWLTGSRRLHEGQLPGGYFLSNEFYRMSVHQGTHVDAPFHYGPYCMGKPAKKILDVPLDWLVGEGIVLDIRAADGMVTEQTVKEALRECGAEPGAGSIVLFRSDCDRLLGTPRYVTESAAITPGALDVLLGAGVKVLGTDCWSFDGPPRRMVEDFFATKNKNSLWPAHMHGRDHEFILIEGLANLRSLPDGPFTFIALPVALADAGAAWCRAVAFVPDK